MKILITGANGFLGQELIRQLVETNQHYIIAVGRGEQRFESHASVKYFSLDLTDAEITRYLCLEENPACIIHAAAITQADDCEMDKPNCWLNNVTVTETLVNISKELDVHFIYISTDFVFDGRNGPYDENAIATPVNYYGESKLAAEKIVLQELPDAAVIRTVLVYGTRLSGGRHNIVSWAREKLEAGEAIKVVHDQFRTPTYVGDLAAGVILAVLQKARGIYHVSGTTIMTPYDMVTHVATQWNFDKSLITAVTASTFKEIAERPKRTGFVCNKAMNELGYRPRVFTDVLKLIQ